MRILSALWKARGGEGGGRFGWEGLRGCLLVCEVKSGRVVKGAGAVG
jgi:hypothetical protein